LFQAIGAGVFEELGVGLDDKDWITLGNDALGPG
jgi:hypothetical protein